jgi:hypothetical protein
LVGARGFEPPTPCAQGRCATRLRYAPTEYHISDFKLVSLIWFSSPALSNFREEIYIGIGSGCGIGGGKMSGSGSGAGGLTGG